MTPRRRGCQALLVAALLATAYIRRRRRPVIGQRNELRLASRRGERVPGGVVDQRPGPRPVGGRTASRTIVIGDIHGCIDELNRLLAAARYSAAMGDRVILLGDLINKGTCDQIPCILASLPHWLSVSVSEE